MQRRTRVRRHQSPAQKDRLLAQYRRSGLTQRQFAAKAGIGYSTLTLCLRKATPARKPAKSTFVAVPNLLSTTTAPAAAVFRGAECGGGAGLSKRGTQLVVGGGATAMMPVGPATRIFLAAGATDLRKSFGRKELLVVGLTAARAFEWIITQPRKTKPPVQSPEPADDVPY
jgi:transposase-like protein